MKTEKLSKKEALLITLTNRLLLLQKNLENHFTVANCNSEKLFMKWIWLAYTLKIDMNGLLLIGLVWHLDLLLFLYMILLELKICHIV